MNNRLIHFRLLLAPILSALLALPWSWGPRNVQSVRHAHPPMSKIPWWKVPIAFDGVSLILPSGKEITNLASGMTPAWSPDHQTVAYGDPEPIYSTPEGPSKAGIYIISAHGGTKTRITTGRDYAPAWSPDGTKLAFVRSTDFFRATTVEVVDLKTRTVTAMTDHRYVNENPKPCVVTPASE